MPRKGRELEILVQQIEKVLAPDAKIESPSYLIDKDTGQKREVDICIRQNIGSSEIVIIIECRDRTSVEDSTWIEQLISKKNSILVNKVIAVSSNSFSKPAILKAQKNGIDIRLLKSITDSEIEQWLKGGIYIINCCPTFNNNGVAIEFKFLEKKEINEKKVFEVGVLKDPLNGTQTKLYDFIESELLRLLPSTSKSIVKELLENEAIENVEKIPKDIQVKIGVNLPKDCILHTHNDRIKIDSIVLNILFEIQVHKSNNIEKKSYRDDKDSKAEMIIANFNQYNYILIRDSMEFKNEKKERYFIIPENSEDEPFEIVNLGKINKREKGNTIKNSQ